MASIAASLERDFPDDNFNVTVMVQTLHDRTVGSVQLALVVLLGAVAMVLLIACANVANLVLVRGAARQNEIAVRTALGAGRRGLVSYLLTENLVLAVAGGVLGLVLAAWGIDVLKALAPANLPRLDDVRFDVPTFAFSLAVVFATTLLFGLGPSLQLSRTPLSQALGQRGAVGATRTRWTRSTLLVAEVGLSVVLLLGAGLLLRSLQRCRTPTWASTRAALTVFTVSLPPARYPAAQVIATHERLDEQTRRAAGRLAVARISGLPLGPSENVVELHAPGSPAAAARTESQRALSCRRPRVLRCDEDSAAGRPRVPADRSRRRATGRRHQPAHGRRRSGLARDPIGRPIQISGQDRRPSSWASSPMCGRKRWRRWRSRKCTWRTRRPPCEPSCTS